MRPSTKTAIFAILVVLAAVAAYLPGLSGPLLFDDRPALTGNALAQIDGATFDEWRTAAFSSDSGPLHRPIAMLSFAADYVVTNNFSPFSLKAGNLAIHLGIGALLYFFCYAVLESLQIGHDKKTRQLLALAGAAAWLLHPLNVSTVLYAVQRMAQLATLWVLAGLLIFMRYRQRWAQQGATRGEIAAATLWLILLTALAALSKENGALLPWLAVVLEACIFRGVWAGQTNRFLLRAGWILLMMPVIMVVVLLMVVPETLIAGYAGREFTLEQRLLTQGRLLWRYLGWIVLPNIGDMGFQHDDIPLSSGLFAPYTTALALAAWGFLLTLCIAFRRRYPLILLAVLFFLVGHSMESTVLPLEMVYEHRNYLPGVLVCLAVASVVILPLTRTGKVDERYPIGGVLAILCLLLAIRVQGWSDELTLSRVNLAQHPESSRSNYFYANALLRNFRRGDLRGLTEQQKEESLLLARHYFERMHQENTRDVAALVMLYYLDSSYFIELQDQVDWLAVLEELLESRQLQPSDWNALSMLFEILTDEAELASEARVLALLDLLAVRYGDTGYVLRYRYQYLSSKYPGHPDLFPLLQQWQVLDPRAIWVYYALLAESSRSQDVASMYDYARLWLLHDTRRRNINQLKSLFTVAESESGEAND